MAAAMASSLRVGSSKPAIPSVDDSSGAEQAEALDRAGRKGAGARLAVQTSRNPRACA